MKFCSDFCNLIKKLKESEMSSVEPNKIDNYIFDEASPNKKEVLINYINAHPYIQEVTANELEYSFVYSLETIVEFLKTDDLIDCLGVRPGILEGLLIDKTLDNIKINIDKVSSIKIKKTLNNDLRVDIKYLKLNENNEIL